MSSNRFDFGISQCGMCECAYLRAAIQLAEVNIELEAVVNPRTERKPACMAVKRVERWVHIAMAGHRQRRHPLHVTVVRDHG